MLVCLHVCHFSTRNVIQIRLWALKCCRIGNWVEERVGRNKKLFRAFNVSLVTSKNTCSFDYWQQAKSLRWCSREKSFIPWEKILISVAVFLMQTIVWTHGKSQSSSIKILAWHSKNSFNLSNENNSWIKHSCFLFSLNTQRKLTFHCWVWTWYSKNITCMTFIQLHDFVIQLILKQVLFLFPANKMKALFWQWTLITTLCLAAQCIAAPFDNSKYLQVSSCLNWSLIIPSKSLWRQGKFVLFLFIIKTLSILFLKLIHALVQHWLFSWATESKVF